MGIIFLSFFLNIINAIVGLIFGPYVMAFFSALLRFPQIVHTALSRTTTAEIKQDATVERLIENEATVKDLKLAVFDLENKQTQLETLLKQLSSHVHGLYPQLPSPTTNLNSSQPSPTITKMRKERSLSDGHQLESLHSNHGKEVEMMENSGDGFQQNPIKGRR